MLLSANIANAAGVNFDDVDRLLKGKVNGSVGTRLGVPDGPLEDFINGRADNHKIAALIGVTVDDAIDLRRALGREGAIGLIFGLLLARQ